MNRTLRIATLALTTLFASTAAATPYHTCGDPADDGCSFVPNKGHGGVNFRPACDAHDRCYSDLTAPKSKCDGDFFDDLARACRNKFDSFWQGYDLARCLQQASSYGTAVSVLTTSYLRGQANALTCTTPEEVSLDMDDWIVIDPVGGVDSSSNWTSDGDLIMETGNAYDAPYNGRHGIQGTWLWNPDVVFGRNYAAMDVTIHNLDNDAAGLMWGVVDEDNYYRVVVDRQRGYIRMVQFIDGVAYTMAQDTNYQDPGTSMNLRVERRGGGTNIYVNGRVAIGAHDGSTADPVDGPVKTGGVGLFSWANDGVRFQGLRVIAF